MAVVSKKRLPGGIIILSGTDAPVSGATGTGRGTAIPGSLYIRTSTTGAANQMFINRGTKASPTWERVTKTTTFCLAGRNGAGAITATGARAGDSVVCAVNLTDATNDAAKFEATVTVADQIQQSDAGDLTTKKILFQVDR